MATEDCIGPGSLCWVCSRKNKSAKHPEDVLMEPCASALAKCILSAGACRWCSTRCSGWCSTKRRGIASSIRSEIAPAKDLMKILLYNPDNGVTRNFMPHLWMFLLQALTPPGHEVVLIDGNAQAMDGQGIARYVREHN